MSTASPALLNSPHTCCGLWEQVTKGTPTEWQSLSVLAKQAWRNRANRGHLLAQVGRRNPDWCPFI
jgi:hypothetical protein